jgi:hypothetical protein
VWEGHVQRTSPIPIIDGLPTYSYYSYEQSTIAKNYCLVGMLDIYEGLSCEAQR